MGKGRKKRRGNVFIGVWVSGPIAAAVDKAVQSRQVARSSFLRSALKDKLGAKKCPAPRAPSEQ